MSSPTLPPCLSPDNKFSISQFSLDSVFRLVSPVLTAFVFVAAAQRVCRSPGEVSYDDDDDDDDDEDDDDNDDKNLSVF